ncbi:MAG: NAD(P)-dependent oxidoreductase [Pseudomonadota bacterium]
MSKIKILLGPSQMGDPAVKKLEENGFDVIPNPYKRKLTKAELKVLLKDVEGIIAGLEPLDKEILETSTLEVISRCGSGITNVDSDSVKKLGIHFFSTPLGPTASVAELTICSILSLLRNTHIVNKKMHDGIWEKNTGFLLSGKTVVIIGFGKIGQAVSRLLEPFNVQLIVVDPFFDPLTYEKSVNVVDLGSALPVADIVLIHSSSEEPILKANEFELIKKGSFILNASRGNLVDETALIHALNEKKISGAWLDVFQDEPYSGPLSKFENVILTPHIASYTVEGRLNMENEAVENLIKGFKSKGRI